MRYPRMSQPMRIMQQQYLYVLHNITPIKPVANPTDDECTEALKLIKSIQSEVMLLNLQEFLADKVIPKT